MSSPVYYSTLQSLGLSPFKASTDQSNKLHIGSDALTPAPLVGGTVGSSWNFTAGDVKHQEVEPAIYTQGSSPTTVVLSQRLVCPDCDPNGQHGTIWGKLYSAQTSDFASFTRGYLPTPISTEGYLQTADPWLAGNPYSSGLNPGWLYATGVAFQQRLNEQPNAIALWHSTDGGRTWSTPSESAHNMLVNRNTSYFYDKPAMATSTNIYFLGRVYVAFTKLTYGNPNGSILCLARSRDGQTFDLTDVAGPNTPRDTVDIIQGYVTGAQVVVDNTTGIIYVTWTNMATRQMKMATIFDDYSNPAQRLWVQKFDDITPVRSGIITPNDNGGFLNGGVKAWSFTSTLFFWPTGRICVTWHEMTANSGTEIFFTAKKPSDPAWPAPVQLTAEWNDQFMPALDGDSNDNTLIAGFYDRSNFYSNNVSYQNAFVIMNDSGTVLHGPTFMTPGLYDPTIVPFPDASGVIGDYQGIFGWNFPSGPRFNSAHIRAGSTTSVDAWATGIQ